MFCFFLSYIYNSQSVPEPDQFNSIDFDREKFIESQPQINRSFLKPKRFRPNPNLFIPFWPFPLYYPPSIHEIFRHR